MEMNNAIILDVLPSGAPFTLSQNVDSQLRRRNIRAIRGGYLAVPLVFALAKTRLFLMVAATSPDHGFKMGDELDLGEKTKIAAWARINYDDLSSAAKSELEDALDKLIKDEEPRFTDFFNRASPITTRMHSLELIPGIGKKHMWEIIESRRKPFESLAEVKERLPLIADLKKGVKERILKELRGEEKYYLFVLPPRR
jgi:putative nucleotide binding protein